MSARASLIKALRAFVAREKEESRYAHKRYNRSKCAWEFNARMWREGDPKGYALYKQGAAALTKAKGGAS